MDKPKFDPSKPFDSLDQSKPKFDPSKPFDEVGGASPMGRGEAAITTLADSSTGGMLPTISGLQEGYEAAKNSKSLSDVIPNAKKAFSDARSGAQKDVNDANTQYPYQSLGVGLVGSAPLAMALPGGTALKSVGAGLMSGTGQAIGHANTMGDAAKDIGTAGLLGGILGSAGGVVKGAGTAGQDLANTSDKYALSGSGFMLKDFRNADAKGKIPELANTIRQEGLLNAGDSVSNVAEKSSLALKDSGDKLDSIWENLKTATSSDKAKDLPIQSQLDLHGFDPGLHKDEVISTLKSQMKGQVGAGAAVDKVGNYLDELSKDYPGDLKPSDIRDIRQNVDQIVNWSKKTQEMPAQQQAFKGLASFIRDKINTQADAASQVGYPEIADALKSENKRMSNLITIGDAASDKVSRNDANRFLSLTDSLAGAGAMGGMMAHSPEHMLTNAVVGGGAALANKTARTYGPGLMSAATNALSGPASIAAPIAPQLNTLGKGIQSVAPMVNQVVAHRPDVKSHVILGK